MLNYWKIDVCQIETWAKVLFSILQYKKNTWKIQVLSYLLTKSC